MVYTINYVDVEEFDEWEYERVCELSKLTGRTIESIVEEVSDLVEWCDLTISKAIDCVWEDEEKQRKKREANKKGN